MNDDIKEILDFKENADYKRLSCDEIKVLRDYITNLQQKEELFEKIVYKYDELKQENERLKKQVSEYQDEIFARDNNWYDMQD